MKTARILLLIGGVANTLFFCFHIWLGWQIHRWDDNAVPGVRSFMEMLNGGGALFVLFLALASLTHTHDMLSSRLGHLVAEVAAALYLLRAVAEIVVSPKFNVTVFSTCLVTALLYVGVWFARC